MDYQPNQLPAIDIVEIVDLKGLQPNCVSQYMQIAQDALHVSVEGETAQQIAQLWRKLPPDEPMRCHTPPFGLRFYGGNRLLVQGSVCWRCNNIFVEENGEDLGYSFDGQHEDAQQLYALLKQIIDQAVEFHVLNSKLFQKSLAVLRQLSEPEIGAAPSGDFLRVVQVSLEESSLNDGILATLESARRTFLEGFESVEFMFFQPSADEQCIALCGRSVESVAEFDFQALEQRVVELVREILVTDWKSYYLFLGDILFEAEGVVVEISAADLRPTINGVAMIKQFTFGHPAGEGSCARVVADFIRDLLRYVGAPSSLTIVCNDSASLVILTPEALQYLRTLADPSSAL
jgi:hypothetical protein